jgi:hypothetical protein
MQRVIDITCSPERLSADSANRRRMAACQALQATDRPPVVFAISLRYLFDVRGVEIGDYFENPRTQLEQQLLNYKWLIENVPDDRVIDRERVTVKPDLQTIRGGYFDIDVDWFGGCDPVTVAMLEDPADVDRLGDPAVTDGLYGRKLEMYEGMRAASGDYRLTLNGEPVQIDVSVSASGGPFPDAYALARQNIFVWMHEAPEAAHRLMDKVTTAFINYERHTRQLTGASMASLGMGCDAGEMLSEAMFRQFVLPYYLRCYEAFPGRRGLHMCGRIDHLVELLADEMRITHLNGFGSVTDAQKLARHMGGKVVLTGGFDPVLLLDGPVDAIADETVRLLDIFSPHAGYIVQDGNNVAPGTPRAHMQAVVDAVRDYVGA